MVGLGTGAPIVQVYHEKSIILPDVSRVLACLYEKDIKFETHTASYKSLLRLQASSHAPVPFYDGPTFLEESRGICRYIAEKYEHQGYPFLLGKDALERASVEQWLHNEEHAFNPPSRALYCHLAFPLDREDGDDIDLHTRKLEEVLEVYEQRLSDSRFLAGNKFTLADLVHLPNSHYITSSDKFVYLYDSRKNVSRWWEDISTRKSWQQVLRDMKRVEEQNKQDELKKQQQQRLQKEHPRTSGHPIRIYSRKQTSTEPRTILVPPADTVSPSSIVPPFPADTFPDEAQVSSSQSTPTSDKSSAVLSKETTVFNAPDKTPPTSAQSTPTTSIKYPIPVQSIKGDSSPTTAKKPPVTDAAMSSTKDASISEPTVRDLHTRFEPISSKGVSNNLDVFDYHPSHTGTDEETPYIEPTPRRTSETFDAFSGSNIAAGPSKTSPISAKEEPDQSSVSDFYKSDSRATGIDSRYKESIPYSGRTTRKLEPTDTSGSKPHTSDVYHRPQAEQWHTASTGLNDLKQEADYLMPTQQGKPSKDVKQYPSQDSEQATSHPVPEEPVSMELVQRQEYTTRRPYTDQRSRGIVDDNTSSDQRRLLPSTQEHDATPSRQEAAKDARGGIPSQAGYHKLQAEQWHTASTGLNDLKQEADHLMSTQQRKPSKDVKQYPSQDSEQATSHPVPEETMSMELVQRQEYTTRRPYTDQRSSGIVDDKSSSDQRSALLLPSPQEHDATPSRQEAAKGVRGRIPSQAEYSGGQDTNKQPRHPASVPRQRAAQDARGTFGESKAADSTLSSKSSPDASRSSLPRQDLDGARHTTAPFQKRYPGTGDASKQAKDKISTPWQIADKDAEDTTEETKSSESSSSQEQPLYFQRADAPPWKQGTTEDHHSATSAIQEKHANVKDTTEISKDVAFKPKQMNGQDDQDTFKATKSGGPSLLRDQQTDTWQAASTIPEQEVNKDGLSAAPPSQTRYPSSTPPSKTRFQIAKDANKQPRGTAPIPKKKEAQDDTATSEESNTADEVASTEHPLNAWRAPISPRRQEAENSSRMNTSFQKRYPDDEDDIQVAGTAFTSWQVAPDSGKDISEETKLADSTPSAKPLYRQQAAPPLPRQAEVEDAQCKGRQSRVTIHEPQKMVPRDAQDTHGERKTATPGEQFSDRPQAIPQSRPAAAKDVQRATGETMQFPDILDTTKKSRDTFEETKVPESTLPRTQPLGARDAQHTIGESRIPTDDQRKDVLRRLQPYAQDPFQQSKLSAIDQKGSGSSSSQERDVKDAQATTSEDKSISTERHKDTTKRQPKGSITVEKTSSIYQKQPPVAQDSQEQAQIIEAAEKANGSIPKHQLAFDIPYTAPATAKTFDFDAEEPYRKDTTDDQKLVPPRLSKEPTSQVQPTSESLQEAASHGGLSSKPSTIEQWQRVSMPLNDDEIGMATIDQKPTPMSQEATPSADGVNQMAKESGEQRVEPHVPTEAETSGVQSASPSFPGASTAHHATTDDKFAKQSIIGERVGEPTKMQASIPDSARAHTKRATPMGHEIGGSELVSIPDGQISEVAKARRDQATPQQDVHDANFPTHDVAKDTFKETKVADSTPSSAKPMYTQRPAPTPRHAEVEDTSDKGIKSRETVPDRQKMVERRAGTAGEQLSDRLKGTPPSRQAPAEDALSATGDTIQSLDGLKTFKKARGTYEEAKDPGSMLHKAQSLGAQDAQRTTGESTTPTAGQRKDFSTKPQPDVQDGSNESKLSIADWNDLGSLSPDGRDAIETGTAITGEKPVSMERLRETSKKSESTTPKAHSTDSQGSVEEKTSSIYQKKPLVAQDSQEQAQTIPLGEKADASTPKRQQVSDDPNTFDEKLKASEPARAKTHEDFSAEKQYREGTTDDQKMAPPLLSRELTSQVQPPSEPSHDAVLHGDLSSKPSTIDQWRRTSAPLHDVATSSGEDEVAMSTVDQKPTPMRQQESDEQRVEPPVPIEAETSGFQRASPSFPGASVDDHATIGDKFAKESIIDERVGKPIQMQTSSPDAHPASEPTKRATPEGHGIGDSDDQISEATKARDDPGTVHEDVYDVNLSTHDVGKDTFKETKVADSTPISAEPMYIKQPAITPRQIQVGEARDKSMQSRETIPEQQKIVERKAGISGEQSSDRQKTIRPSRQVAAAGDAPTGDTIQSPYVPDNSKKSRGTFEEAIDPGSTSPKAQALDAQDSQLAKGESSMPTADQRKDWKDAKDDETIMPEEKSFSTERLREMFQESEPTTPKTQPTDSKDYSTVDKTFPVYQKGPLAAQIIQAGEKVDSSTPEHLESSGAPYTSDEKLSASAPARADIRDDHTAEGPYKEYTASDQKVAPSLPSEEPASQMQPLSEAELQRAVPDRDSPSKSSIVEQWQRASAPLHGVSTDSGDAEVAMSSNNDKKSRPMSQEALITGSTSMDPQRADTLPAEVAHSEWKSAPLDKESTRAEQPLSPVEPRKADSNVSAANYKNAPQTIFRQQARPSAPSTIGIPASYTQGVIGKIQEVTPDDSPTDDSGRPFVPSEEQVSRASQAIPGQEEMASPPGTTVSPTSDTQLASPEVQEGSPDDQQAVESTIPLFSSGKQGSPVDSASGRDEGAAEKKFALSDQELPQHSAEQPTSSKPRKEETVDPASDHIKKQPIIIGQQGRPDAREPLTSEDVLDTSRTRGDVHLAGSIEPERRPLSVHGEEPKSTTQAPTPNVQSLKPSIAPVARGITPGSTAVAEQISSPSGQFSADPAKPAFPLGPRNKEIRDSTPSALLISSTDSGKGDAIAAVPEQAKDMQTTPSPQDMSTQRPSGKVHENTPGENLGKDKPLKPSSAVREGRPSTAVPASAPGIQLGSQKLATPGQDSAYPAQPPSSDEPRSKEIGDLAPSTQLNSTTEPRNGDAIVAAPDQAKDSQTTPAQQVKLSAPSTYTQRPSGTLQEDEPADNSGQSSARTTFLEPAPGTQYGTELPKADVDEQKFASPAQEPSFSTKPTKEDTDVAATDQTSTLEKIIDKNDTTPAQDKAKIPFSGTSDASRETQKNTDDDDIDEKLPGQGRVPPYSHVSESPEGPTPEARSVVDKEATLGSSQEETLNTRPDPTSINTDSRLSSGDVPAASSFPEAQDLQGPAYAQNIPADSLEKIESPGHLSTDQAMAPIMSPSVPSVAPLGTLAGTDSVQPPQQASMASTADLESVRDTQHGIPEGEATPAEQKFAISDQEPPHNLEPASSAEPRKEEANAAAGDQPNVPQGPETTVRYQVKASSDAREALRKDQQPSVPVLPEQTTYAVLPSDLHERPTPEVDSNVVDKETTLLSSQAQTSAAEPDSTPISGDVSSTSSLQNQDTQPPLITQAPTTQSLQGSAPTQDDSLRKLEPPIHASANQVMEPVTSSAAPSDAPQGTEPGQDFAQSIQPPLSTETTEDNTVVAAPDQTKDMETITHQQAITPAPDTAKTTFPGTDQDAIAPVAGPTSMDRQLAGTLPTEVAHSEQKPAPSEKGSARAAPPLSPVEPINTDRDISATDYSNAQQMIFREQARPSAPSTIGIPASDIQGVIGKIEETPDNRTDDSGKPSVPNQQVSHVSQAIPGEEEMASPPDTKVSPTSATQLASAEVQEVSPDDQQAVEPSPPLSTKQSSHVGSAFVPDQESPHSVKKPTSLKPRKEQIGVPTAEQIKEQPTIIGQQDTVDPREVLTSEDALDTTPIHGDIYPAGSSEPSRRPLSVQGEEPKSATQAPPPRVAKDPLDPEDISTNAMGNVQSLEPSITPDARGITPGSTLGNAAVAEQISSPSGQNSADPVEPAFSLGPQNKEMKDSSPSALLISSTDPGKQDDIVAVPDQAKDLQTTPSQQDILSAQHSSGKVQENIPGDNSGKDKSLTPAVREGKPPSTQLSATTEPRSKDVGDLAPSTQANSITGPRNGDAFVTAPDQAEDSQTTPGQQVRLSVPSSYRQHPSGTRQEDEPVDNSGEGNSSKPPSVSAPDTHHGVAQDQVAVDEEKVAPSGHFTVPALGTQYGTELQKAGFDGQKFSPLVQDSVLSAQPSFSTEPTKEDTDVAATDQTSTLENITDQNGTTPAPDKAKTPFLDTPDVSRETHKSTDDDHIDEKLAGQGRVSPYSHVSESPEEPIPDSQSDVIDKKTTLGSSQAGTSNAEPDSTIIGNDARLSSGNVPASSSLPETQDRQGSAYAQNVPTDSIGKSEPPGHLSADQAMEPRISPSAPSVAPLETVPGTNPSQLPQHASLASTGDQESVQDTQHGIPHGEATPAEQKSAISDQEPAHTSELPSSAEPRKEEAHAAAGDQPDVPQGPETIVQHQVKAPSPDAREPLWKDQQSSRDDDHISNSMNPLVVSEEKAEGPSSEVSGAVDKKMTLPSSQVQTSSTGPESTPISGDTLLSSVDAPATSSSQNEVVDTHSATQVPTPQAPLDSASTQNVPADSLGEIIPAPQGTESDQVSHASEPPFSAEPSNKASRSGHASESREGTTPEVHSPVVDAKTTLPSRQVRTANTGPDSTPISGDVPDRSSLQNQEAQPPAATQAPTVQAEGSASTKNEPVERLGDIRSLIPLPTEDVVAPTTSFPAPSDSSQGTEPGTNLVQPSEEASFDFKSDEKPTMTQGDQAKTLPNGDLPTSQVVGQSESVDSKQMESQNNLKGASIDENPKMQQQIEDNNKESDGTGRSNISTTFEELQKQPLWPKRSMQSSDEPESQQQTDQAVQSLEGNGSQAGQTKAHDTETGGAEGMEASEYTNQKNNRISQVENSDHSRNGASGVQQPGENTKYAPHSTEDAPNDVQAISKSKESSRFSEDSKVQLQSEDKTDETEAQTSKIGQPRGDIPANSYQSNSSQSQAEASDKSVEQSYPGIQNKNRDSSRLDDSADPTKPGDVED